MSITLQQCKELYKETFYIEDDTLIDVLVAIACSAKNMKSDAIWMLIIGPPSCGKTTYISVLTGIKYAFQISTLTENALLSGMAGNPETEKSLLHKIGEKGGLILMKDFTTILTDKEEKKKKILGELREVYEGHLTKATGNGKDAKWGPGAKVNFVGAVTDAIYMSGGDDASMGRRMIDYIMPKLSKETRKKMAKKASYNINDIGEKRDIITKAFGEFITAKQKEMPLVLPLIPEEIVDELIDIADFSTIMRTATKRDFHGNLTFTPEHEVPIRMNNQLLTLAQVMTWLNDGVFKQEHKDIIIKMAFDSISQQRRIALQVLARYDKCSTKGIAQVLGYPTTTILTWMEDINVIKGCKRSVDGKTDMWELNKDFKVLIQKYDGVPYVGGDLRGTDSEYNDDDGLEGIDQGTISEYEKHAQSSFEAF